MGLACYRACSRTRSVAIRLASAAKADADAPHGRPEGGTCRERSGSRKVAVVAAAQQRTGTICRGAGARKAHIIVAEGAPSGARRRAWHPIRHPLIQVA